MIKAFALLILFYCPICAAENTDAITIKQSIPTQSDLELVYKSLNNADLGFDERAAAAFIASRIGGTASIRHLIANINLDDGIPARSTTDFARRNPCVEGLLWIGSEALPALCRELTTGDGKANRSILTTIQLMALQHPEVVSPYIEQFIANEKRLSKDANSSLSAIVKAAQG